jgi:hypothetical protein
MVDFTNERTVSLPLVDINKIQILERRKYVIDALEAYFTYRAVGGNGSNHVFKARLTSLFWEIQGVLKRKYCENNNEETYKQIMNNVLNPRTNMEILIQVWAEINIFLDLLDLTKVDTKVVPKSPRNRPILLNEEKGF